MSKAIGDTKSGGTCYILPFNYADDTPWGKEGLDASSAVLDEDATLVSGATLTLPMGFEGNSITGTALWDGKQENGGDGNDICSSIKGWENNDLPTDRNDTYVSNYLCCCLTIEEGITLTINGTLNVGGVTGRNSSAVVTGHTTGCYSQITLSENSKIEVNGGMECYGYIKETERENGSAVIINSGASLQAPLVVYDYPGGSLTTSFSILRSVFAFEQWDMPNLQSTVRVNYGGTLYAYYDCYANKKHLTGSAPLFANSSALFNFSSSTSYVTMKYHAYSATNTYWENKNWMYSSASTNTVYDAWAPTIYQGNDGNNHAALTTDINIYGGASLGSLSLTISSYSISSASFYLPISYRYQISLFDGTYNIANKVKFLPGSSLHVYEGATINQSADMIFYSDWPDDMKQLYATRNYHPSLTTDSTGYDWSKSHLTIDGNWNVGSCSFGGYVDTSSNTGSITFASGASVSASADEVAADGETTLGGNNVVEAIQSESATGPGEDNSTLSFTTQAGYKAVSNEDDDYHYWEKCTGTVTWTGNTPSSTNYKAKCLIKDNDGNEYSLPNSGSQYIKYGTTITHVTAYASPYSTSSYKNKQLTVTITDSSGNTLFSTVSTTYERATIIYYYYYYVDTDLDEPFTISSDVTITLTKGSA